MQICKKFLSLLGVLVLAFSVSACNSEEQKPSESAKAPEVKVEEKVEALNPAFPFPEKDSYDIVLAGYTGGKIQVITFVREISGMRLKEGKDAVNNTPATIMTGVPSKEAKAIYQKSLEIGATLEMK